MSSLGLAELEAFHGSSSKRFFGKFPCRLTTTLEILQFSAHCQLVPERLTVLVAPHRWGR